MYLIAEKKDEEFVFRFIPESPNISKKTFLNVAIDFLLEKNLDLGNSIILLPSNFICHEFKKLLTNRVKFGLLPKTFTLRGLITQYSSSISKEYCYYKELITLVNLLENTKEFSNTSTNLINMARSILDVLEKKSHLNISMSDFKNVFIHEYPEHFEWLLNTIEALQFQLNDVLSKTNHLTYVEFESQILKNIRNKNLIVIGEIYCSKYIIDFFNRNNTSIILEVFEANKHKSYIETSFNNLTTLGKERLIDNKALIFFLEGLNTSWINIEYIKSLNTIQNNQLLLSRDKVEYFEFESYAKEVDFVFDQINLSNEQVGVLVKDTISLKMLVQKLNISGIKFLLDAPITYKTNNISTLITNLLICGREFSMDKMLSVLRNKYFITNSNEAPDSSITNQLIDLEIYIRKNFIFDEKSWLIAIEKMELVLIKTFYNRLKKMNRAKNFRSFYLCFRQLIRDYFPILYKSKDFFDIESKIKIIGKLKKDILTHLLNDDKFDKSEDMHMITKFQTENIIDMELQDQVNFDNNEILDSTRSLEECIKVHIFTDIQSISVLNFLKIFIMNFYSGNEVKDYTNTFIPLKISEALFLNHEKFKDLYHLQNLFKNQKVILTRSLKGENKYTLKSKFILPLDQVSSYKRKEKHKKSEENQILPLTQNTKILSNLEQISILKPNVLYATHLEKINSDPYSFYVEKILKIKNLHNMGEIPGSAEFGSLIHKCIEYFFIYDDKIDTTKENIMTEIMSIHPKYVQNMWQRKINTILDNVKSFHMIEFAAFKQKYDSKIKIEHTVGINFKIDGHNFDILAIIDRLELHYAKLNSEHKNKIIVIDYKTGICPNLTQIRSFKAIQLLISCFVIVNCQSKNSADTNNCESFEKKISIEINSLDMIHEYAVNTWRRFSLENEIELQYLKLSSNNKVQKVSLSIDEKVFVDFFKFLSALLLNYKEMEIKDFKNLDHDRYKDLL